MMKRVVLIAFLASSVFAIIDHPAFIGSAMLAGYSIQMEADIDGFKRGLDAGVKIGQASAIKIIAMSMVSGVRLDALENEIAEYKAAQPNGSN